MCDLGITLKLAQPSNLASFPPHFFLRLQSLKLFTTVARQGRFGPFRKRKGSGYLSLPLPGCLIPKVEPGGRRASSNQEVVKMRSLDPSKLC